MSPTFTIKVLCKTATLHFFSSFLNRFKLMTFSRSSPKLNELGTDGWSSLMHSKW
ncbi:hypothetical protein SOVF_149840 [Spinacia oleracea]|nr:hypothetical protein SOVF_149840 [Spinacia oleracea]